MVTFFSQYYIFEATGRCQFLSNPFTVCTNIITSLVHFGLGIICYDNTKIWKLRNSNFYINIFVLHIPMNTDEPEYKHRYSDLRVNYLQRSQACVTTSRKQDYLQYLILRLSVVPQSPAVKLTLSFMIKKNQF